MQHEIRIVDVRNDLQAESLGGSSCHNFQGAGHNLAATLQAAEFVYSFSYL